MTDKNGVEICTGDVVRISGSYFKNANGLYFVRRSPGDAGWSGDSYGLTKISKAGKISKVRGNIGSWPLSTYVSSLAERAKAYAWNTEHAEIEVVQIANRAEIKAYFANEAERVKKYLQETIYDFGADSEDAKHEQAMIDHYDAIAASIG